MRLALPNLILMLILTLAVRALAAEPVKIALVTRGGTPEQIAQLQGVLTAELSGVTEVALVEREAVGRVLQEQGLVQQGIVDPATLPKLGSLLGADGFVVIELDAVSGAVAGLVGFDARTGARLLDQTLATNPEGGPAAVAPAIRAMAAKHRSGPVGWRIIAMMPPRNADLPVSEDGRLQALNRIIERTLLKLPGVVMLERERLEHVLAERALPTDAASATPGLQASAITLQLEASRGENNSLRLSLLVTGTDGRSSQSLSQRVAIDDLVSGAAGLVRQLAERVLDQPGADPVASDRDAEAHRFAVEAALLLHQGRLAPAVSSSQAALALSPDVPAYKYGLMLQEMRLAVSLLNPRSFNTGLVKNLRVDDATLAHAERLTLDALNHAETVLGPHQPYERKPSLRTPWLLNPGGAYNDLPPLIVLWRRVEPGGEGQRAVIERVRVRYRQFVKRQTDLLFAPQNRRELEATISLMPLQVRAVQAYSADRGELAAEMNELLGRWLANLESCLADPRFQQGRGETTPLAFFLESVFDQFPTFFAADNGLMFAYDLRDLYGLSSLDTAEWLYPSLKRMAEHSQPQIRHFGRMMTLWADQRLKRIDESEALRRLDTLLTEIASDVPGAHPRTRNVLFGVIGRAICFFDGAYRHDMSQAARDHPVIVPMVERVARGLIPHANGYAAAAWLRVLIESGDESQRRWAYDQIAAVESRLQKDNKSPLAELRRDALLKHPALAPPIGAWTAARKVFVATTWASAQSPRAWGQIRSATVRGRDAQVFVEWVDSEHTKTFIDLVRVPLDGGDVKLAARTQVEPERHGGGSKTGVVRGQVQERFATLAWPHEESGIWVLPLDGGKAFHVNESAGLPGKRIESYGLLDRWLLVATADPGHLVALDLTDRERTPRLIASASRMQKQSELDDTGRLRITAIIPDAQRRRFVLVALVGEGENDPRQGFWSWSPEGGPPKMLFRFQRYVGSCRVAHPIGDSGALLRIDAMDAWFDLSTDKLALLVTQPVDGNRVTDELRLSDARVRSYWGDHPPKALAGDWIWCGTNWDRLNLNTASIQSLPSIEEQRNRSSPGYTVVLLSLPERKQLLAGDEQALWLLDLEDEPEEDQTNRNAATTQPPQKPSGGP